MGHFQDCLKIKDGAEIEYKIKEAEAEGYRSRTENYDVINTLTGTTGLSGTKTWWITAMPEEQDLRH